MKHYKKIPMFLFKRKMRISLGLLLFILLASPAVALQYLFTPNISLTGLPIINEDFLQTLGKSAQFLILLLDFTISGCFVLFSSKEMDFWTSTSGYDDG